MSRMTTGINKHHEMQNKLLLAYATDGKFTVDALHFKELFK